MVAFFVDWRKKYSKNLHVKKRCTNFATSNDKGT